MKLYRIFLPKKYNEPKNVSYEKKKEISWEIIVEIAEEIEKRFGGYSLNPKAFLPVIQGSWTDDKGINYKEEMYCLEVFTEDTTKNKKWMVAYKEMIKQKLNQEEIFIVEQYAEIL